MISYLLPPTDSFSPIWSGSAVLSGFVETAHFLKFTTRQRMSDVIFNRALLVWMICTQNKQPSLQTLKLLGGKNN